MESKTTKSVVNKKQKQMMGEEGYDVARDEGRVKPSKDKKDGTTMTPSKEMEKTRKLVKGKSALERVKADIEKRYGKGAIMNVKKKEEKKEDTKEELDLTQVAESLGGYLIEQDPPTYKDLMDNQKNNAEDLRKKLKNVRKKSGKSDSELLRNRKSAKSLAKSSGINMDDLDTSRAVKDEIKSNLGNKARQDAGKDQLLDKINQKQVRSARKRYKNQPSLDAVKRDIDTRELINPDRRSTKRVSPSGTKFKTPSKPKVPTFEKTPIKVTKPSDVKLPQGFKDFDRKLKSTRQSFARQRVGQSSRATRNVVKNLTKGGLKKTATKATVKTIGKVGGKQLAKTGVKIGAKALGKTALKQIPFVGQAIAGAEAVGRFASGDAIGAGIALASAIPGLGIGADAANAARDIRRATKLARKAKTLTKVTKTGRTIQGANVIKRFKRSKMAKVPKFLKTKKGKLAAQVGGAIATPTAGGLLKRAIGGAKAGGDAVGHVGRRSAGSM